MQKTKKQKYQQEIKKNLKCLLNLQPELVSFLKNTPFKNQTLLNRTFPYIHGLQVLRIFTLMEINFIVASFIDIIQKTKNFKIEDFKIGIIGGGIMGRLIINTLLVFTKQGLKPQNILISTRQPDHLQFYVDNFGIKTFFDNEKIARDADLIFVSTPATLDNWILVDLKKNIHKRLMTGSINQTARTSYATTINVQRSQTYSKSALSISVGSQKAKKMQSQSVPVGKISKKLINLPKQEPTNLRPCVYILTSDFRQQKCSKIFDFPVMVPWLQATDISGVMAKLISHFQTKNLQQFLNDPQKVVKQLQGCMSQKLFGQNTKISNEQTQNNRTTQQIDRTKEDNCQNHIKGPRLDKYFQIFSFSCRKLENALVRQSSFSINKQRNQTQTHQEQQKHKFYADILKSQGSYSDTFLTKCRKWRMAYHNFVS